MNSTIKRAGLWALGAVLPKQQVLDRHMRHMARGVAYLLCGGIIVATVFLALLAGAYFVLLEQGLTIFSSAAIIITMALLGAVICFLLADRSLHRAARLTEELKISTPALPKIEADVDLQEGASVLINAFLAGFRGSYHTRRPSAQPDLFDEKVEPDIGKVHVRSESRAEPSYDEDKDIIRFRPRHEAG